MDLHRYLTSHILIRKYLLWGAASIPAAGSQRGSLMAVPQEIQPPLRRSLEFLLLTYRVRGCISDLLQPVSGDFGLAQPDMIALLWLSLGPSTVTGVAKAVGIQQNGASILVERLSARHLVKRRRRQDDRRVVTVTLTDAGRSMVSALMPRLREQLPGFLSSLSGSERDQLVSMLQRLSTA